VAQAATSLGSSVVAIRADVTSAQEMSSVAERLKSEFGGLDVVFANAGIAKPRPIGDVDDDNIDSQVAVNFKGVIYTVQKMLPILRKPASVILTSTAMTECGIAGMSVYAATKAAVRSLARTWSAELLPRGVRVNVVSPGLTQTPIYGKLGLPESAVTEWAGQLLKRVPLQRLAEADEVAKAVLFLASSDSSYMAGESVLVDGGLATV
jgi:NAD(P)-dependent dehydrogenase (short-subunit alcohol dehydrogenase family)